MKWDSFTSANKLIELGEQAAMAALPTIRKWLPAAGPSLESKAKSLPVTA
jgi:hypothetical protein